MSTDYLIKKYNLHKYHLDIAQILLEQIYSTTVGGKPLIEYGQIEDRTGRNKHTEVGDDVGTLSRICHDELDLPMISVIVVCSYNDSKFPGQPGQGFYDFWKEIYGIHNKSYESIFNDELNRVINCSEWYKLENALGWRVKRFQQDYVVVQKTSPDEIGNDYNFKDYEQDFSEISLSKEKRADRTKRHQALLRLMAEHLKHNGYYLYKGIMDCVAVKYDKKTLLIEVKTLSSDGGDELYQMRRALSQLLYYEEFHLNQIPNISNKTYGDNLQKIAFFEHKIQDKYILFLEKHGCKVLWKNDIGGISEQSKT